MRQCHIRDGTALVEYFAWLENELLNGKKLDEVEAADKLEQIRRYSTDFGFLTIVKRIYLLDCRSIQSVRPVQMEQSFTINRKTIPAQQSIQRQFTSVIQALNSSIPIEGSTDRRDGTTDTTRTISFHPTSLEQSRAYTLVLKGHIAIDRAIFPKSTTGFQIDSLARQFLWSEGLDYFHGTGHGVGSFLNVHEGPAGIGPRIAYNEAALKPGMVLSNGIDLHRLGLMVEPGFYKDSDFGIRIENVVIVKEVETPYQFGDRPYYGFEHVTMVPMDRRLIEIKLLDEKERKWVDDYHKEVWEKISPRIEKDGLAWKWLHRECQPLQ